MKAKVKKSFLSRIPSWALSLITAVFSLFLLFILAGLLSSVKLVGNHGEDIAYIIYDIVIAIACFLICKRNPKGIWYVPIICNVMGIIAAFVESTFWVTSLWMFNCGGWVLSVIGAISGALIGLRNNRRIKN